MTRVIIRIFLALFVPGGLRGACDFERLPQKQLPVATAKVRRGDVIVRPIRRELRAVRSVSLIAPNLLFHRAGDQARAACSLAREKDLIVEFDDSERRASLEETLLEVDQIDEQIKEGASRSGHAQ